MLPKLTEYRPINNPTVFMNITKITITISKAMNGQATDTAIDIETKTPSDTVRGVEAIKILNDAISQILEQIV